MSSVVELAKSGAAEDLQRELRAQADSHLYYFAKVILDYKDMVDHLHLPFCDHLQHTEATRKRGYLYPRGHFKSTVLKAYILWRLIRDPNLRILVIGESEKVAAKNLRDIKWNILNNQVFRWLYPEILPEDINKTKWTDTEILLPRSRTFDESSITTIGVGAKGTGFHYDLLVYDDMIGFDAARSEPEMEAAIDWFRLAPGFLNDPERSEEVIIGTRWKYGEQDLYGWIMANMPLDAKVDERPSGFTWHIRSAVENEQPIFLERFSLSTLEQIRKREGDYKFSCQYLNQPIPDVGSSLDSGKLKTYTIADDMQTMQPTDGSKSVKLHELHRVSFYDPSGGGAFAKSLDAIVGVGMSPDRRIFFLEVFGENAGFTKSVHRWQLMNDKFKFHINKYEAVGAYKSIGDLLLSVRLQDKCPHCEHKHLPLIAQDWRPEGGSRGASKDDRIRVFIQSALEEGRLYIRPGMTSIITQVASLGVNSQVDELDAAATAIHHLRAPDSYDDIETQKADLETKRALQVSRISTEHNYGGYV